MELPQRVILASSSPWRRQMLLDAGVECDAIASGLDERAYEVADPEKLALLLAREKAKIVFDRHPDAIVIGADQVAYDDSGSFGKPEDPVDHFNRLWSLRGRPHWLTTGVVILSGQGEVCLSAKTTIQFRKDLEREELLAYVASGEGSDCAGGYQIEGRGAWLIEEIDGDWFNVVGLPVLQVVGALRDIGWRMGKLRGPQLVKADSEL